ncbi:MAG: hypothetical protein FJW14_03190 [Acidimicrobiia bacterium]|nr:hypothetical protein [Acidimicrobiia bacterium]
MPRWTWAVLLVTAPFLAILCTVLWQTPFPVTEAVALFEDVTRAPVSQFFFPETAYYRPLFHASLSTLWHYAGSLEAALAGVRLLHIIPVVTLLILFVVHVRPTTLLEAAAATLAVAVLAGSRGFRDNLEIPLSYTIVGMPLALFAWVLANREPRAWRSALIVLLTLAAIGFKEQGLVLIPLVVTAWWMGAPGATRGTAAALAVLAVVYVAARVAVRESWAPFEQAIGLGFIELEPDQAEARFGGFPYLVYAYTAAATIGNVLFSEPTRGIFRIVNDTVQGHPEIWEMIHLLSSAAVTALVVWWGVRSWRADRTSLETRLFVVTIVVLLASGALSFNYSRDRLGGMAVPFYALSAFFAIRAAAGRALTARRPQFVLAAAGLALLAAAWQSRAISTIEIARIFSARNSSEWLLLLPDRRVEFAERPVYLDIMQSMIAQGTAPGPARPTHYPRIVKRTLGLP